MYNTFLCVRQFQVVLVTVRELVQAQTHIRFSTWPIYTWTAYSTHGQLPTGFSAGKHYLSKQPLGDIVFFQLSLVFTVKGRRNDNKQKALHLFSHNSLTQSESTETPKKNK